jgi:hypothetical protein
VRATWEIDDYVPPSVWLSPMLTALTEINAAYLRANLNAPRLYSSGVRYRRDPNGRELWWDIPVTLRARFGDCKKLACWRAAELRERDYINAVALPVLQSSAGGVVLVHVIVQLPDGRTEDPSRILGMEG